MGSIKAAITGVEAFLPEYRLTNEELSTMVETSDEWIMQRVGIKERRILKGEGMGTSDMGAEAVKKLLARTGTKPEEVDVLICSTITPDMFFPNASNLICHKAGLVNAFGFDLLAACSGYLFGLETAVNFIESGRYKKVVLVGGDKMSAITDYTDRTTCVLFGDAATATLIEPAKDENAIIDTILHVDGSGTKHLHMKAGGSVRPSSIETVTNKEHVVYQEGQVVFKVAVSRMGDTVMELMERNQLSNENLAWLVPHQANLRIIDAVGKRAGVPAEKVMINIQRYGNTTAATIPLCLWEWQNQLKKGDNVVLCAFGGGYTWGAIYLKWAYNS